MLPTPRSRDLISRTIHSIRFVYLCCAVLCCKSLVMKVKSWWQAREVRQKHMLDLTHPCLERFPNHFLSYIWHTARLFTSKGVFGYTSSVCFTTGVSRVKSLLLSTWIASAICISSKSSNWCKANDLSALKGVIGVFDWTVLCQCDIPQIHYYYRQLSQPRVKCHDIP